MPEPASTDSHAAAVDAAPPKEAPPAEEEPPVPVMSSSADDGTDAAPVEFTDGWQCGVI